MEEEKRGKLNIGNKLMLWALGLFAIGLVTFIFIMSAQNGAKSQGLSISIIRFIKENIPMSETLQNSPIFMQTNFNTLLRKITHFTEFFILASILHFFIVKTGFKKWKVSNMVLIISLILAAADEFHQVFVRGRSALLSDVLVDFAGAALAIYVIHTIKRLRDKKKPGESKSAFEN